MDLKNRERFTTSIDSKLVRQLKELSNSTKIPMSKLVDEALEDLFKKRTAE